MTPDFLTVATPFSWSNDFYQFMIPYYDMRYTLMIGLACWFTLHVISGFLISRYTNWVEKTSETLRKSDIRKKKILKTDVQYQAQAKWEIETKVTALVHAIISSFGAFLSILSSEKWALSFEDLYKTNSFQVNIVTISCTYFVYDLVVAVIERDLLFLIHGTASSLIYINTAGQSSHFCIQLSNFFLLYEFSTIFLNIRALMISAGLTTSVAFSLVEKLFFSTFMVFRMIIGLTYSIFWTFPLLTKILLGYTPPPHSYIVTAMFYVTCIAINLLNVMWSHTMIKLVLGASRHSSAEKIKKTE